MGKLGIQKKIVFTLAVALLCSCNILAKNITTSMPSQTYTPPLNNTPTPISTPTSIIWEFPQEVEQDYWPSEPLSRDSYSSVDIETDPSMLIQDFRQTYNEALKKGETWIKDPIAVSLKYSGYPNFEGIYPSKMFVFSTSSNQVIVILRSENLKDDSVRDLENRVDLIQIGDVWKIEWAGYRQRCYRSNFEGWTTGLCP
jgi:hypothetical protein